MGERAGICIEEYLIPKCLPPRSLIRKLLNTDSVTSLTLEEAQSMGSASSPQHALVSCACPGRQRGGWGWGWGGEVSGKEEIPEGWRGAEEERFEL